MEQEQKGESFFAETQQLVKNYVQDRLLLLKYEAVEKGTKILSLVFATFIYILLCFFFVIFVSIMGGFYFAELTGNNFYGFAIVAGFYAFLLILFVVLRKTLIDKLIGNTLIREILRSIG